MRNGLGGSISIAMKSEVFSNGWIWEQVELAKEEFVTNEATSYIFILNETIQ